MVKQQNKNTTHTHRTWRGVWKETEAASRAGKEQQRLPTLRELEGVAPRTAESSQARPSPRSPRGPPARRREPHRTERAAGKVDHQTPLLRKNRVHCGYGGLTLAPRTELCTVTSQTTLSSTRRISSTPNGARILAFGGKGA